MLRLHSSVKIITNSSTVIYTTATEKTIETAIKLLEALGGNKNEFDFQLIPGNHLVETMLDSEEGEYLTPDMIKTIDNMNPEETGNYVRDLITNKAIEYPTESYDGYEYEWDLIVTRNGKPFNEFNSFFSSFDQEAFRDG